MQYIAQCRMAIRLLGKEDGKMSDFINTTIWKMAHRLSFFLSFPRRLPISSETILLSLLSASRALPPLPSSAPLSLMKRARRSVWLV